jgi:hypothetical protein
MQIDDRYWIIIHSCMDIFGEAWRCYKAEAYLATCIMCRDSVEAILHLARTVINFKEGAISRKTYGPNRKRYPSFKRLQNWAKREHLLDGHVSKVESIKNEGDFGAHLLQKVEQAFAKMRPDSSTSIQLWISKDISWTY